MTNDVVTVCDAIEQVRDRWRRRTWLAEATRAALGLALAWGAAWLAVRAGGLAGGALLATFGSAMALSAGWVALVWRTRPAAPSDRALARHIEEACPDLDDRLVTAVDVVRRSAAHAGPLDALLMADAATAVGRARLDTVVPAETLRQGSLRAGAAALVLLLVGVAWIAPAGRALGFAGAYLLPGRVALQVSPGHVRVAPGQPLVITAHTAIADVVPELVISRGGQSRRVAMTRSGDRFSTRFDTVPGSFEYRVSAAGDTSPDYRVTLLEAPTLAGIDLRYEFPAFTKLPPREERDGGDIYAPAGTKVQVTVRTNRATTGGALVVGNSRVPLAGSESGPFTVTLPVANDGSYRVSLTSRDGLVSPGDTEYFIRVLDDRPPEVRIIRPAVDRQVTPLEEVTVEARADDDYGIAAFDLVYSIRGGPERVVPFGTARQMLTATGRHTLYLEDLGVSPGDFVTYYARARDIGRGKRATEARSDIFFLEVTPFNQEFSAAQSQAMAAAGGNRSLDDLVNAQKDIIVATWKLDRRSGAGRSAADARTVARAQGDLRQRVERAASGMRGPRRRPAAGGDGDGLASAAAAMARAERALDAVRTADAIPPEMEALNHLLKVQAENRRREVMRQQAGMGGSGGNRAQQDLSSLFDRELRRQQQTNYETPRTAEEREPENGNDTLEKLRALAARQEQLARQQDDLARSGADLQAEERKRRLERLTREQSELRRQAEQLAEQMKQTQAGQQASQDRSGSAAAGGTSSLRDASEEMQAAAGELRKDDPRQASERGRRAAERLRTLERQMQGQSPDERRRALGDLQVEARQLADRQRQLGSEADAHRGRPDAGDVGRRLAGEQDRLADRADRLEQQVRALGASGSGTSKQSLADTSRELAGQHVGDRMRDAARALRGGDEGKQAMDPDRATATGREAVRALERLADRLGDAAGSRDPDERRLSDQLSRARDVRDRMSELQRQIEGLQQGAAADGKSKGQAGQPQGTASGSRAQGGDAAAGQGLERQQQLERLTREYNEQVREAARLRRELDGRQGTRNGGDGGGSTPEGQLMVLSAPGTEAFKQDFSKWEVLHKDVTLGLERLEATLSEQLLERAQRDRLASGAADEAPAEYRDAVERYFRSLAAPKE